MTGGEEAGRDVKMERRMDGAHGSKGAGSRRLGAGTECPGRVDAATGTGTGPALTLPSASRLRWPLESSLSPLDRRGAASN